MLVIDGNHRAAIADQLGVPLPAELIPLADHLRNISTIPELSSTARSDSTSLIKALSIAAVNCSKVGGEMSPSECK